MEEISLQYPGSVLGHFEWTMWEMSTKTHRKFWTYTLKQWICFKIYIYISLCIYMYTFTWSIHLCSIVYINHSFFHYANQSPANLLRRPMLWSPWHVQLSKVPMDADNSCLTCMVKNRLLFWIGYVPHAANWIWPSVFSWCLFFRHLPRDLRFVVGRMSALSVWEFALGCPVQSSSA